MDFKRVGGYGIVLGSLIGVFVFSVIHYANINTSNRFIKNIKRIDNTNGNITKTDPVSNLTLGKKTLKELAQKRDILTALHRFVEAVAVTYQDYKNPDISDEEPEDPASEPFDPHEEDFPSDELAGENEPEDPDLDKAAMNEKQWTDYINSIKKATLLQLKKYPAQLIKENLKKVIASLEDERVKNVLEGLSNEIH